VYVALTLFFAVVGALFFISNHTGGDGVEEENSLLLAFAYERRVGDEEPFDGINVKIMFCSESHGVEFSPFLWPDCWSGLV
jgi:hypothetical protein